MSWISGLLFLAGIALGKEVSFEHKTLVIGKNKLNVELAESPDQQEKGLMFRKKLSDDQGMLFIFTDEKLTSFWMKNTLVPLSIGYFDKDKTLLEILDMEPASPIDNSPPLYSNKKPAKFALEVPKGWFQRKKIKVGDKFKF